MTCILSIELVGETGKESANDAPDVVDPNFEGTEQADYGTNILGHPSILLVRYNG